MFIEVCDLCKKEVKESNKTEVIIKDYKGAEWDGFGYTYAKRKYKAVICDDCLNKLKGIQLPTGGSVVEPHHRTIPSKKK